MADTTRYTTLRDLARDELQLTTNEIGDVLALTLFREALKVYSRFRGIRKTTTVTFAEDTADYTIATVGTGHIVDIYWNDTYPTEIYSASLSTGVSEERLHNPSLAVIEAAKYRAQERSSTVPGQVWRDYYDGETRMINLDPVPTTDIIIEYREIFTEVTYPENDSEAIRLLFKAKMLGHLIGIAQLKQECDLTFNLDGMAAMKVKLENDFYGAVRTAWAVHQ